MRLRSPLALIAAAVGAGAVVVFSKLSRRYTRVEVAGASMTPALEPGDYLLLRRGPPRPRAGYGDIVALRDPRPVGDGRLLLKRVVGLPGEQLRIGGGPVQINGRVLIEQYAHGSGPYDQHRGINRLAADEYFLLGDHRGASTDSRDFGPVPLESIDGVAVLRYWPPSRLGRLGRPERRLAGLEESAERATPPPEDG